MTKQFFLVSIDTEAPIGRNAIDNLIYCKTKDGEFGINYIMDMLDKYKIKGLFFVDVAEAWHYGNEKISNILKDIENRGHDIGVHVHPDHMADPKRRFLWQYTYEEQYTIIKKCTDFYEKVLHRKPISFRAGRYGANNDTINILSELGYKYDMSMYFGMKKRCKIEGENETINSSKYLKNGVIEIPVTVFNSFDLFGYKRFDKLDESMPYGEFKNLIEKMIKFHRVTVGSFFMHSFSFVDWRKNPDKPKFNTHNAIRINKMLRYIADNKQCEYVSERELSNLISLDEEFNDDDIIKLYSATYSLIRACKIIREKFTRDI